MRTGGSMIPFHPAYLLTGDEKYQEPILKIVYPGKTTQPAAMTAVIPERGGVTKDSVVLAPGLRINAGNFRPSRNDCIFPSANFKLRFCRSGLYASGCNRAYQLAVNGGARMAPSLATERYCKAVETRMSKRKVKPRCDIPKYWLYSSPSAASWLPRSPGRNP
jgi:hypothetical protein